MTPNDHNDLDDPYTLLPTLVAAAKVVYVIVSVLAIGLILPLLVSSL